MRRRRTKKTLAKNTKTVTANKTDRPTNENKTPGQKRRRVGEGGGGGRKERTRAEQKTKQDIKQTKKKHKQAPGN